MKYPYVPDERRQSERATLHTRRRADDPTRLISRWIWIVAGVLAVIIVIVRLLAVVG